MSASFEKIASRFGGLFQPRSLFRLPAAAFPYRESNCRIRLLRRGFFRTQRFTEFRISWPFQNLFVDVARRGAPLAGELEGNPEELAIEDASFHAKFAVRSSDPQRAQQLLTSAACWELEQLLRQSSGTFLHMRIQSSTMTVLRAGYLTDFDQLDDFLRLCLELFDQFALTQSEGIDFHDGVVAAMEQMQCPVCSCDITGRMVVCVRCKTPHCHDCWLYNGKCGMYGCDEKRFAMSGPS